MTEIVALSGVAPAVGVSTLADGLREAFVSRGRTVDLVEEDEVLTRPVFAPMARELTVTGLCAVGTMAACVSDFARESAKSGVDVVICDSLFPFVRSLSDWDYGEIAIDGFLAECTEALTPLPFTLVYLDADIGTALQHAAEREPAGWLEWYLASLIREEQPSTKPPLDVAVDVLDREREVALRLMAGHGWDVRRVPETDLLTVDETRDRVLRQLDLWSAEPQK
jgi:hypothetical protein